LAEIACGSTKAIDWLTMDKRATHRSQINDDLLVHLMIVQLIPLEGYVSLEATVDVEVADERSI
jgi:hypothetical protein